jgi:hypothetical protein
LKVESSRFKNLTKYWIQDIGFRIQNTVFLSCIKNLFPLFRVNPCVSVADYLFARNLNWTHGV